MRTTSVTYTWASTDSLVTEIFRAFGNPTKIPQTSEKQRQIESTRNTGKWPLTCENAS